MYKTKKQKIGKSTVHPSFLQSSKKNSLKKFKKESSKTVKVFLKKGNKLVSTICNIKILKHQNIFYNINFKLQL